MLLRKVIEITGYMKSFKQSLLINIRFFFQRLISFSHGKVIKPEVMLMVCRIKLVRLQTESSKKGVMNGPLKELLRHSGN